MSWLGIAIIVAVILGISGWSVGGRSCDGDY